MMPPTLNRPVFASDTVRFVGDIVAAVVADTRAQAMDAAEAVVVDYDPLPAVIDRRRSARARRAAAVPGARLEHLLRHRVPRGRRLRPDRRRGGRRRGHDGEPAARRRADGDQRHPRGAQPTAASRCWVSHQAPHAAHGTLRADARPRAREPPRRVPVGRRRLRARRPATYVEHLVAGAAALKLGRPVKWIATRSEDMVVARAGSRLHDDRAARRRHRRQDRRASTCRSSRAPARTRRSAPILPMLTQMMAVGVYEIPKVRSKAVMALTNNTTIGAYRGAGRPEATQLIERVLDVAAERDRHGPGRDPPGQLPPARELPVDDADGRELRQRRVREGARRRAEGVGLRRAFGPSSRSRRTSGRFEAARHRRLVVRRGDRTRRLARRVRRGRGQRRRHGDGLRRHERRTARVTRPRSRCSPATSSASRWTRSTS